MRKVDSALLKFLRLFPQVIKKPMDLGTIREKLDKKDGHIYRTPEEVAADVRLVFRQARRHWIDAPVTLGLADALKSEPDGFGGLPRWRWMQASVDLWSTQDHGGSSVRHCWTWSRALCSNTDLNCGGPRILMSTAVLVDYKPAGTPCETTIEAAGGETVWQRTIESRPNPRQPLLQKKSCAVLNPVPCFAAMR